MTASSLVASNTFIAATPGGQPALSRRARRPGVLMAMQTIERQLIARRRRRRQVRRAASALTLLTAGGFAVGWTRPDLTSH